MGDAGRRLLLGLADGFSWIVRCCGNLDAKRPYCPVMTKPPQKIGWAKGRAG